MRALTYGTTGYRTIMADVRADDIRHDPYGTAMSWLFAIAAVTYHRYGVSLAGYRSSPVATEADLSNASPDRDILAAVDSGAVTEADLAEAYAVLDRLRGWAEAAGRSY